MYKQCTISKYFNDHFQKSVKRDVSETEELSYNTGNQSPGHVWNPQNDLPRCKHSVKDQTESVEYKSD